MKRIFALALACALSLSMLTACGGGSESGSASGSLSGSVSQSGSGSLSTPEGSVPDGSASQSDDQASLTLNKSDITLKSAGASAKLKYEAAPELDGVAAQFASSDESVATVSENGTVTAVAPGTATITVTYGDLTAQCIVRCSWEEKSDTSSGSSASTDSSASTGAPTSVDLAAFYNTVASSSAEFPAMMQLDPEMLEGFYPGLSAISTKQCVVYAPMITAVACEIAMVECANAADAAAVKAIFQSRIDTQVDGGAWYPETIEGWKNNAKIVTQGSYVGLFVMPEGMMDAAAAFNDLF